MYPVCFQNPNLMLRFVFTDLCQVMNVKLQNPLLLCSVIRYCVLGFVSCCNVFVFSKAMPMFSVLQSDGDFPCFWARVVEFCLNLFLLFSIFHLKMDGFVLYLSFQFLQKNVWKIVFPGLYIINSFSFCFFTGVIEREYVLQM